MLYEKITEYIEDSGIKKLLANASTLIIGFSGGADSTALLSYFVERRSNYPSLSVVAAHVDHMIRPGEAERDRLFCEKFCSENVITFECLQVDVPQLARESGKGLEEAARDARYAFFEFLRTKYNGALIATAHNANDNLETLLFNITRGSGTRGVGAISPIRDEHFIRPLLSCTGEEIRAFAAEHSIPYVTDSTNSDTSYTRNALRAKVVPLLKDINPKVCENALSLSAIAREDCDFIESEAEKILAGPVTREVLRTLHPALFQRVILALFRREAKTSKDLSRANIADCKKAVFRDSYSRVSLPDSLAFFADKNQVYIKKDPRFDAEDENKAAPAPLFPECPLDYCGYTVFCTEKDGDINTNDENIYNLSLHGHIDCDKINGNLYVRTRQAGDTVRLRGQTKKLKKLLCDSDIPKHIRDTLPIICDDEGIIFVPFIGQRDGSTPDESSKKFINLHIGKRRQL